MSSAWRRELVADGFPLWRTSVDSMGDSVSKVHVPLGPEGCDCYLSDSVPVVYCLYTNSN